MLPLETRGRIAAVCMWLIIFSCGASILTNIFLQDYIIEVYSTPGYEDAPLTGEDIILFLVSLTWPVASLFSAISFLMWAYRARANLDRAGLPSLKYKPYWTVVGFMIPILSLVRPFQVMQEIWNGSKYISRTTTADSWQKITTGKLVGFWWAMTLIAFFMRNVVDGYWEQIGTLDAVPGTVLLSVSVDLITIFAAYITAKMITEITDFQGQALVPPAPQPEVPSPPVGVGV
jgi:hypothetical protein